MGPVCLNLGVHIFLFFYQQWNRNLWDCVSGYLSSSLYSKDDCFCITSPIQSFFIPCNTRMRHFSSCKPGASQWCWVSSEWLINTKIQKKETPPAPPSRIRTFWYLYRKRSLEFSRSSMPGTFSWCLYHYQVFMHSLRRFVYWQDVSLNCGPQHKIWQIGKLKGMI